MTFWARIKKRFNDFLEKMAKENEKAFGGEKLDCCQLNNKQSNRAR